MEGERDRELLKKVRQVMESITAAKHVDQIILSLYTLASQLFSLNASLIAATIDPKYQNQVSECKVPSDEDRSRWRHAFYKGGAPFPALSRVLLLDVASDWLACFPYSARKHVYDVFFTNGHVSEVVQILVPFLQQNKVGSIDVDAVHSNTERLLMLCLFENNGILQMAREFDNYIQSEDLANNWILTHLSRLTQIVVSIPDKSRLKAPASFSSHSFFRQTASQLLCGVEGLSDRDADRSTIALDGTLLFAGEIFSRICRRGSVDVLISEVVPRLRRHVQFLTSSNNMPIIDVIVSDPYSQFWLKIMEMVKDPYAVEIMSERILHQLASEYISDTEAYWILWILFHRIYKSNLSIRSMFSDKYLLWKVFPVRCLRWVLQFSVLECPPDDTYLKGNNLQNLIAAVQRLVAVWCDRKFVQSASVEQQAYITAAVGILLEKMSKEELDGTKDVMNLILQGVSCRLDSPDHLIRKMASRIALVFSKIIDPQNPLYLDDSCTSESTDWEFGLSATKKGIQPTSLTADNEADNTELAITGVSENKRESSAGDGLESELKGRRTKVLEFKMVDPDEIVDPATLNNESGSDQCSDDEASYRSDASDDSSLQPYDLSDDDMDVKEKISQLIDLTKALRKTDDADSVERALDVAEKLVRASPDELIHAADGLARSLVQVRCSDVAIEGEEDSIEEKRQRALVALLVTCPFVSLDTLNKLLYSPNVDTSQRIMILDVMTEAAQELANTRTMRCKQQKKVPISTISENQPWFLPSSSGPSGASPWKEISGTGILLNWSNSYEREIASKPGQTKRGKTRRWSLRSINTQENQMEWSNNKFPVYAAAFMLPAMHGYDKKRHGVDLLDRDFIVLGKLVHMLGVCMKCAAMHPEASVLAPTLLDMLRSRELCHHKEAYVRRAVLFAVSCILVAVHPTFIVSSLSEGNIEISTGLEWIRTWALDIIESDIDKECYEMAMVCLHLHAEMALQVSRALESVDSVGPQTLKPAQNSSKLKIKIPFSITEL